MGYLLPSNDGAIIASGVGVAAAWIMTLFEDIRMNNVSANGLYCYLYTTDSKGGKTDPFADGIFIQKFADDADAITFDPSTITHAEPSFNGPLVTNTEVPVYHLNVSVIPFSEEASNLDLLVRESSYMTDLFVNIGVCYIRPNPDAMKPFGTFAEKTKQVCILFEGGKVYEASPSSSVSQYRLSGRRYTFVFSGLPSQLSNPPKCETLSGTWSL